MLTQVRSNVNLSGNYLQYIQEVLSAHSGSIISTSRKHCKGRQNSIIVQAEIIAGRSRVHSRHIQRVFPAEVECIPGTIRNHF